ncbi:MAG: hypothetical protein O2931_11405 [Planctomycetota bacterium]|nr:hypothetical protein [Planctomycetota bacterium]MDA1179392.1 hypothetical protein [Planctomycetota bacterium]
MTFWLRDLRTPTFLAAVAREYPHQLDEVANMRPLLQQLDFSNLDRIIPLLAAASEIRKFTAR